MILLVLLGTPLVGAALLTRLRAGAALTVHGACATATTALAVLVATEALRGDPLLALGGLLRVDALSGWMTGLIGLVAGLAAIDAPAHAGHAPRRFYPLLHLFVFTMLLAVTTDDVGLMWVAIEGTTLASVFLVSFERTRASVEAAYKYVLICSVGIALAFVGTVVVYFADVQQFGEIPHALRWTTLRDLAPRLPAPVIGLAFVFLLVGYGTKAGLVPMHTWLPDAHSEAPAPVSALMSGVLLSVGVYAVLRFKTIATSPPGPTWPGAILVLAPGVDAVAGRFSGPRPTTSGCSPTRASSTSGSSASASPSGGPGGWRGRCFTSPTTPSPSPCSSCSPGASAPPTAPRRSTTCAGS
jgi:formate hydrogenlyase subunit 3/multisubunit Na+/H+ antiporter MnhD subunit